MSIFQTLKSGMKDAIAFAKGNKKRGKVHHVWVSKYTPEEISEAAEKDKHK